MAVKASRYRKYGAVKTPCGFGHIHDSKKEAFRCNELHMMQRAGHISDLQIQVKYELIPAQYVKTGEYYVKGLKKGEPKTKQIEQACFYVADFVYHKDNKTIIEDTKGVRTPEYKIKRKLMRYKYCNENTVFIET